MTIGSRLDDRYLVQRVSLDSVDYRKGGAA